MQRTTYFLLRLLTVALWSCVYGLPVCAQEALPVLSFQTLAAENGLSANQVWALYKDSQGYLWAGTEHGLNRFDGQTNTVYLPDKDNPLALPAASVFQIFPTPGNDLLVGTQAGLALYRPRSNDFISLLNPARPEYVFPFFLDDQNRLWLYRGSKGAVCTYHIPTGRLDSVTNISNGYLFVRQPLGTPLTEYITRGTNGIFLNKVSNGKHVSSTPFFTERASPDQPVTFVDQILWEGDTLIWLCADIGLIALNPKQKTFEIFGLYKGQKVDANCVVALSRRYLLVGTDGLGLLCFDKVERRFCGQYRNEAADPQSLPGNTIYRALLDEEGNLFLAVADQGIAYTNVTQTIFRPMLGKAEASEAGVDNNITAIAALPQQKAVLLGSAGSGLLLYDVSNQKLVRRLMPGKVQALTPLWDGSVLIQSTAGFAVYDPVAQRIRPLSLRLSRALDGVVQAQHIALLPDSNLLIATAQGLAIGNISNGALELNFQRQISRATEWDNYQFAAPVSDSQILLQTYATNLYLLAYRNGILRVEQELARTPFRIKGMAALGQTAYLATTAGLLSYHIPTKKLQQAEGVLTPCQAVLALGGRLWVSTTAGLYCYHPGSRHVDRYARRDGLAGNHFNAGAMTILPDSMLLAGGTGGLSLIRPDAEPTAKTRAGVGLTGILINDKPFSDTLNPALCTQLELGPTQNNLTFSFIVIEYTAPAERSIYYRLLGYDEHTIQAKGSATVRYTQLPPGRYRFTIATDGGAHAVDIIIHPPWWQKWWVRLLAVLFVAGAIAILFFYRIQRIKKRQQERLHIMIRTGEDERRRIARDLHDDFGARLSTLKLYLQAAAKNKSLLDQSAELIDDAIAELRNILLNLSPKALEEHGLAAALYQLCERINKSGAVQCEVDLAAFPIRLHSGAEFALFRITQELINNTLKYANARHIYLSIVVREAELVFLYEDDGHGFDPETVSRGYGLTNIETYVQSLGGLLHMDARPGRGIAVTITVPLQNNIQQSS